MTTPIDEDATRRATAVITCLCNGSISGARQLIAEDDDIEAMTHALAQMTYGLLVVHARASGLDMASYWQGFAIRQEAAMAWWRDHGPDL